MKYHYLVHLARLGTAHLHPHAEVATNLLINALDLQPGLRVLEIGCGTGATLVKIGSHCNVKLFGVDTLPEMLKFAGRRAGLSGLTNRINLTRTVIGDPFPFKDRTFDRIYAESVLGIQTADAARLMLAEIYRMLKDGGIFAANEAIWKKNVSPEVVSAINETTRVDFGVCQASPQYRHIGNWMQLMKETGFTVSSAQLLSEHLANPESVPAFGAPFSVKLSNVLTRVSRWRMFLSPLLLKQHMTYRRLLKNHRNDGRFIESRLFVLHKNR